MNIKGAFIFICYNYEINITVKFDVVLKKPFFYCHKIEVIKIVNIKGKSLKRMCVRALNSNLTNTVFRMGFMGFVLFQLTLLVYMAR